MKFKKIVMIILLIALVGAIGFVLINTNNKAIANNNQNTTTSVKTSNLNEKVKNNKNEIDDKTVTISAADETNSVTISAENSNQTNSISDNTNTVNNTKSAVKNNHNAVTSNMVTTVKTSQTSKKNTETKSNIRKSKEKAVADTNNMVNITDNFFIEQTNDVYYNMQDYIGKTIKMEGLIYSYEDSNKDICYAVVRNTPGCCGNDGLAGIDIRFDEDYPEKNTWVEVIGVITTDTTFGNTIPVIQVSQMHEKEVGTTFVSN